MMKYFLPLKEEVEAFIKDHYDFQVKQVAKAKAGVNFVYRRKGESDWNASDSFGRNERDFIALNDQFIERTNSIKSGFPYRLFNKIVADLVMERAHGMALA